MISFALAALAVSYASVPRLDGIFVSINANTSMWTIDEWTYDLQAMKAVGIKYFVLAHVAVGTSNATAACPTGSYEAWFPFESNPCFTHVGDVNAAGGTVGNIVQAAERVGLSIHLGLALTSLFRGGPGGDEYAWVYEAGAKAMTQTQKAVAQQLWHVTNASAQVVGIYTVIEENNGKTYLSSMYTFATHYLEPLARAIKALRADLDVWSSPYGAMNRTRYPATEWLPPSVYASVWEAGFIWAPHFDLLAQQDSMGALLNSYVDVAEVLGNLSLASMRQHRRLWSNVELFEVWPRSCAWPSPCHGRHPAPFSRIKMQLANEAAILAPLGGSIIAWEWSSCLSPSGGNAWPNETRANYAAYKAYLGV